MTDWNKKLDAYLHDPPEKVLDLAWHKKRAESYEAGLGLDDTEFDRQCDHTAAAADRLPWPRWRFLESAFDGKTNYFKHPLGKASFQVNPSFQLDEHRSADLTHDLAKKQCPFIHDQGDARAQFFAHWRFWRWWACDQAGGWRLAFLPADTRLPDHTIWVHNSLVSALQSCVSGEGKLARCRPAFLLFQIGPVQDYIAQARRTLDLWSGSYLLSYLIGSGLRHIALNYGPDNVIFPNLCGQPIFDLLLKERVWDQAGTSEHKKIWECFGYDSDYGRRRLLTPSLPNRFLAVLPADKAADIARDTTKEIRDTHKAIDRKVWEWAAEKLAPAGCWTDEQKQRFDAQNERFLDIAWQAVEWPQTPDEARTLAEMLPHNDHHHPQSGVDVALDMASRMPPGAQQRTVPPGSDDHRDVRNFECERHPEGSRNSQGRDISGWKNRSKLKTDAKLDNPGAAWSALYQLVNWQLDAIRQTRAWRSWSAGGWEVGRDRNKDSLNGKEEAVMDLRDPVWTEEKVKALNDEAGVPDLFKHGELLGASSIIKRLWPTAWLQDKSVHNASDGSSLFQRSDFSSADTRSIAAGKPFEKSEEERDVEKLADDEGDNHKYFAVLALDGDEMGKWISGLHPEMPTLADQVSDYTDPQDGQRKGAKLYFEQNQQHTLDELLERKRPLSPSFHLQFSEMLANFSNFCVRRVVEAFDGRLIYSGGDDVLALLPATTALACASALREAFRGNPVVLNTLSGSWRVGERQPLRLFDFDQQGFVRLHSEALCLQGEPKKFHAIVPGPAADCSVGIAIAHFKSPLQDVVRAAQLAEKRAKNPRDLNRSAFAVTLMRRSGEITEWGAKWDKGALDLFAAMLAALKDEVVSAKFPHRVVQLAEAYVTDKPGKLGGTRPADGFTAGIAQDVLLRELAVAADRQRGSKYSRERVGTEIVANAYTYLTSLATTEDKVNGLIGLCETAAFIDRNRDNSGRSAAGSSAPTVVPIPQAERQTI